MPANINELDNCLNIFMFVCSTFTQRNFFKVLGMLLMWKSLNSINLLVGWPSSQRQTLVLMLPSGHQLKESGRGRGLEWDGEGDDEYWG